jgi:hypothetical protein
MRGNIFKFDSELIPRPADMVLAQSGLERWLEALDKTGIQNIATAGRSISEDSDGRRVCDAIFGNSKYLSNCAVNHPENFYDLLTQGPDACFQGTIEILNGMLNAEPSFEKLSQDLRFAKTQAALSIAFADITNQWHVTKVTSALTEIAESTIQIAVRYGLNQLADKAAIKLANVTAPEEGSGLIILGMGKLGAGELNYSSDIDIIILFDPDKTQTESPGELQKHFIRLSQTLVKLLDDRTAAGYVFRTDLRLRPDPGATPIAISIKSARVYYANRARNWERAAFIKARAVAGDIEAGESFLNELQPFIWKGDLDFSSVREIRTIKRQIDDHKNHGAIKAMGHNVKLGRGGIREIEFIAQAQQLVWGGRQKSLRCRPTIKALEILVSEEKISQNQASKLTEAYYFLRRVEHRIQMTNDEQTHSIPTDEDRFGDLAIFLGYSDSHSFEKSLLVHLELVDDLFVHTFETTLLTTGDEMLSDPAQYSADVPAESLISTLSNLGFADPYRAHKTISAWVEMEHADNATIQKLMDLMPSLLKIFGSLEEPDNALERLDRLFTSNPSDDHLYSLILENPQLIGTLSIIMDSAPELSIQVTKDPRLLESIVLNDFFDPTPDFENLEKEITELLADMESASEFHRLLCRWSRDRKFQVALQTLAGMIDHHGATSFYLDITQCTFQTLVYADLFWPDGEDMLVKSDLVAVAYSEEGNDGTEWCDSYNLTLIVKDDSENSTSKSLNFWNESFGPNVGLHIGITEIVVLRENQFLDNHGKFPAGINLQEKPWLFRTDPFSQRLQSELVKCADQEALFDQFKSSLMKTKPLAPQANDKNRAATLQSLPDWIHFFVNVANFLTLKSDPDINGLRDYGAVIKYRMLRDSEIIDPNIANDMILALETLSAINHLLGMGRQGVESPLTAVDIPQALRSKMAKVLDVADFGMVLDILGDSIRRADSHASNLLEAS